METSPCQAVNEKGVGPCPPPVRPPPKAWDVGAHSQSRLLGPVLTRAAGPAPTLCGGVALPTRGSRWGTRNGADTGGQGSGTRPGHPGRNEGPPLAAQSEPGARASAQSPGPRA